MATAPIFANVPKIGMAAISTANTNRDGSGTLVSVLTGSTNGTKIEEVKIAAAAATTAGVVRLFLWDGTNNRLLTETLVSAITPSASVQTFERSIVFDNLVLPSTWELRASTNNAEAFNVFAFGANI